jgi:hypothetical protein
MKTLTLITVLFLAQLASAQSYNDSIYYQSGEIRAVHITKETNNAIAYRYEKPMGGTSSGRIRKRLILGYVIKDEQQQEVHRFTNDTPAGLSENGAKKVAVAGGMTMGVGGIIAGVTLVPIGLFVVNVYNLISGN